MRIGEGQDGEQVVTWIEREIGRLRKEGQGNKRRRRRGKEGARV